MPRIANTWSRSGIERSAEWFAPGYGPPFSNLEITNHPIAHDQGGHFVERRQGFVRGVSPRTSRLPFRLRADHVQRGWHPEPFPRAAAGDYRRAGGASWAPAAGTAL